MSLEEFGASYLRRGIPVVIEGGAAGWPAVDRWTTRYLASRCPDRPVEIRYFEAGNRDGIGWSSREMGLHKFLNVTTNGWREDRSQYYIGLQQLGDVLPELCHEVAFPIYSQDRKSRNNVVWIGADSFAKLHFHPFSEAIATQIMGSKTFYLFPPSATPCLYPYPVTSAAWNFSRINLKLPDEVDFHVYPRYAQVTPIECRLRSGDMIYLPVHWWHAVEGRDYNVLLTTFWRADFRHYAFPDPAWRVVFKQALWKVQERLAARREGRSSRE